MNVGDEVLVQKAPIVGAISGRHWGRRAFRARVVELRPDWDGATVVEIGGKGMFHFATFKEMGMGVSGARHVGSRSMRRGEVAQMNDGAEAVVAEPVATEESVSEPMAANPKRSRVRSTKPRRTVGKQAAVAQPIAQAPELASGNLHGAVRVDGKEYRSLNAAATALYPDKGKRGTKAWQTFFAKRGHAVEFAGALASVAMPAAESSWHGTRGKAAVRAVPKPKPGRKGKGRKGKGRKGKGQKGRQS